jgi:hypothetical protein
MRALQWKRLPFRPGDVIIIVLAFLGWLLSWQLLGGTPRASDVVIKSPGEVHTRPCVNGEMDAHGPLGITHIICREGRVRITSSPCPDHLCMKMGWISHEGEALICLPNRIFVTLRRERNGARVDAVTR